MPRFDDQPHCDCSFFVTKPMIDVPASTNGFELVIESTSEDLPSDFRLKLERNLASNLPADQALAEVSQLDATTQTARRLHGITSRVRMALPFRAVTPDVRAVVAALCESHRVDHAFMPVPTLRLRDYAVLAMDMDSTLITIECIDELGDWCGRKAEIAAITEAAMRGEIPDYAESLRRRVALLAGLDARALESVYAERLRLSPGAERLLHEAHCAGLKTLLVSGGFTFFTDRLRERLGLNFARSNQLEILEGRITGRLLGPIIDAHAKAAELERVCARIGVRVDRSIAIGDGANDLKMLGIAGLGVAYHAKPVVGMQAGIAIRYGGLDRLLDFLT